MEPLCEFNAKLSMQKIVFIFKLMLDLVFPTFLKQLCHRFSVAAVLRTEV
jgi:hypothetical protein